MVRSLDEQLMYADAMNKNNVSKAWIGLHDLFNEGEFVTVLDEELSSVGYANWTSLYGKVEPDNANGNQNCVDIVKQDGGMDDNWCSSNFSYICRIDLAKDCLAIGKIFEHLGISIDKNLQVRALLSIFRIYENYFRSW